MVFRRPSKWFYLALIPIPLLGVVSSHEVRYPVLEGERLLRSALWVSLPLSAVGAFFVARRLKGYRGAPSPSR